jgi:hypothetical protein
VLLALFVHRDAFEEKTVGDGKNENLVYNP